MGTLATNVSLVLEVLEKYSKIKRDLKIVKKRKI